MKMRFLILNIILCIVEVSKAFSSSDFKFFAKLNRGILDRPMDFVDNLLLTNKSLNENNEFLKQVLKKNDTIGKTGGDIPTGELLQKTNLISSYVQTKLLTTHPVFELDHLAQYFVSGRASHSTGVGSASANIQICKSAEGLTGYLMNQIREVKESESDILARSYNICKHMLVNTGVTTFPVCEGYLNIITPIFYYIVRNKPKLTANVMISIVFQQVGCSSTDVEEWSIKIPPIEKKTLNETEMEPQELTDPGKYTKLVQLTDLHIDLLYGVDSNLECAERFLCCRHVNGFPKNESYRAGFYGVHGKCGTPNMTFEMTLQNINKKQKDVKLIYITGDCVSQNVWTTDEYFVIRTLRGVFEEIEEHFPKAKLVFTFGSHDNHPAYQFSPEHMQAGRFGSVKLYEQIFKFLSKWITKDQYNNFVAGGFYSYKPLNGLKVISLNTNYCHGYNLWITFEYVDTSEQLFWFIHELQKSEIDGDVVHIIGSIVPGHPACDKYWSKNYYAIITRFKNIIRGQFFGYTHYDEFKLYYDPVTKEPMSGSFIGGSLSSYNIHKFNNPGYKVYSLDGERGNDSSWHVFDFESWIFDLNEANKQPEKKPNWFKLYSARDFYKIPDMTPKSLDILVNKLAERKSLFDDYYQFSFKVNDSKAIGSCDVTCHKNALCAMVQPYVGNLDQCKIIQTKVDGSDIEAKKVEIADKLKPKEISKTSLKEMAKEIKS